jgi:hypothetical protein
MWKFLAKMYRSRLQAVRAITVGASPFTYQNTSGADESIVVVAGTVSAVAVSRDGTTFYNVGVAASTAGMIRLSNLDSVKVTYSAAPTMQCFPS